MPDPSHPEPNVGAAQRPIRWWPAAIILFLTICASVFISLFPWPHRQDLNIAIACVVVIPFLLFLIWCLFFSRLKWKFRLGIFSGVVGLILFMMLSFRFHGVTGDLVPILQWRWSSKAAPLLEGGSKKS